MNPHGTHTSNLIIVPLAQLLSQELYGVWNLYIRRELSPVLRPAVQPALLQSRTVYLQFLNINAFYSNTVFCSRQELRHITVSYKQKSHIFKSGEPEGHNPRIINLSPHSSAGVVTKKFEVLVVALSCTHARARTHSSKYNKQAFNNSNLQLQ